MKTKLLFGIIPGFLFLFGPLTFAATIYVPDDHTTILAAIDASVDGDTIIVRSGVYQENIDFLGKAITLRSESGPDVTFIHGGNTKSVVAFRNDEGEDSVLEGFTITNGIGTLITGDRYGGGIFCRSSSPTIIDNSIMGNSADSGGGIYCELSSPLISGNSIRLNTVDSYGGGVDLVLSDSQILGNVIEENSAGRDGGGIRCYESLPSITNNIIRLNSGDDGAGIHCSYDSHAVITGNTIFQNSAVSDGGGINCYESSPSITDNIILFNSADRGDGGGIYCRYSSALIADNLIELNKGGCGGGIYCFIDMTMTIKGNVISRNSATSGGGIWCDNGLLDVKDNEMLENSASRVGGGICCCDARLIAGNSISGNMVSGYYIQEGGGGIWCESNTDVEITDNIIDNNSAPSGGGISCTEYSSPSLGRNIISNNLAVEYGFGGGIYIDLSSSPMLSNLVVTGNAAGDGGGIYCTDNSQPVITNCTFSGNRAVLYGGGIFIANFSLATMTNSVLSSNAAELDGSEIALFWHASLETEYSDIESGSAAVYISPTSMYSAGPGMIDADPLFADPSSSDFHLTYDSPCRNAGDGSAPAIPDVDFESDPRIHEGAPDMGADEFHPHLYFAGDVVPGEVIEVKIVGSPQTSPVTLGLGSGILDPPDPTPYGNLYLAQPILKFDLGAIPENGVLTTAARVPPSWMPGDEHPFQSLLGAFGPPDSILTNLLVVTVLDGGTDPCSEGGGR